MRDMAGATAFITGGAQGIGLGLARALAGRGVKLALVDINAAALEEARAALEGVTSVVTNVLDVRDRDAYAAIAEKVESDLGAVSLLFNNAGVAAHVHVKRMTYDHWDWALGVNLQGVVNGIQTFVPRMCARKQGGYIVNTASGAGLVTSTSGFLYSTAKFAVVGMSESLASELAPYDIGVSVLCPGPVDTGIVQNTAGLGPEAGETVDPRLAAAREMSSAYLKAGTSVDVVAKMVLDAMDEGRLHIQTDATTRELLEARHAAVMASIPAES